MPERTKKGPCSLHIRYMGEAEGITFIFLVWLRQRYMAIFWALIGLAIGVCMLNGIIGLDDNIVTSL